IFSAISVNSYEERSGTSNSTPAVTAVAALLYSYFPTLTARQVKDILLRSVYRPNLIVNRPGATTVKVPFSSLSVSGGILNAYNAVRMAMVVANKK
ncbi:MAG TPA: S8 family serine peptidase, partial [Chitinophagaceae bacterium]